MVKARHIPHYIIESRNVFNFKMTENMSKEIVDVLSKYDTTHVFILDAFKCVLKLTYYSKALLKRASLESTITICFDAYMRNVSLFLEGPSSCWDSYILHNATQSLMNYVNILQYLKKSERSGHSIRCVSSEQLNGFLIPCKV
jgi:hypothetical protein